MRTLYIVPIVHTLVDLGKLAPQVTKAKAQLLSGFDPTATARSVHEFWSELRQAIEYWDVQYSSLMLFQDALPIAPNEQVGMELKIVESLAAQGSQNHQILAWLVERGSRLMGTESIELLMTEYRLTMALLEQSSDESDRTGQPTNHSTEAMKLLEQRDCFIAERINEVLDDSSVGVAFLGLMHSIEAWLAKDIDISYPFGVPREISIL